MSAEGFLVMPNETKEESKRELIFIGNLLCIGLSYKLVVVSDLFLTIIL